MHAQKKENQNDKQSSGFAGFFIQRLVICVVAIIAVVWTLNEVLDRLELPPRLTALIHEDKPGEEQTPAGDTAQARPDDSSAIHAHGTPESSSETVTRGGASGGSSGMPDAQEISADSTGDGAADQSPQPLSAAEPSDSEHNEAALGQGLQPDHASAHRTEAPTSLEERQAMQAALATDVADKPSYSAQKKVPAAGVERSAEQQAQPAAPVATLKHPEAIPEPEPKEVIESHEPVKAPVHEKLPVGATFVEAVMQPIDEELSHRFWGWRPNDIINVTDNVNHFQLGVLEVTRRTVVQLTQRIARTGSTDAFNPHLENAMNWLMVKADRYWFPSPESKYKESMEELDAYKHMLLKKKASFYIRTDNLIPLLTAFEDLLGSCDENLVKTMEDDGSAVSFFKADDYFYYAQGVASSMAAILEAVHHDFSPTLESRNGSELLHHAIVSCKAAAQLSPLFIMNSDLDGIFANHRANMAAPISHARFYIGQLIKTLST